MKKSTRTIAIVLFVLTSFLSAKAQGLKVGDSAPDFELMNVDGSNITLSKLEGSKGCILVFTCNHCPFSKAYESRIMRLDKKYREQGFPVVAINPNDPASSPEDSYEKMQMISKEKGYTFPYLFDETQETARAYGASRTPHVYVLLNNGEKMVVKYIGAIDDNADDADQVKTHYVENAVNQLIAGEKVAVTETKAIGCTIKWKK